ncbi:MAG: GGDEF domain-containing protein [Bradymonadia bacterium]
MKTAGAPRRGEQAEVAFEIVQGWWMIGLCALAGASLVAGVFDVSGSGWLWPAVLIIGLIAAGVRDWSVRREGFTRHPFGAIEGPLLWITGAFIVTRLAGDYAGHLWVAPAALVAWLIATRPSGAWGVPVLYAVALELGLTLSGRQPGAVLWIHVLITAALAWGARKYMRPNRSQGVRTMSPHGTAGSPVITGPDPVALATEVPFDSDVDSAAGDFGLLTAQAAPIRTLPALSKLEATPTMGRITLDFLETSFAIHLDLLRQTLGLMTATVLWRGAEGHVLKVRGCSTARNDLLDGPFSMDRGPIAAVFRETSELAVTSANGRGAPPYYRDGAGVGAFFAIALLNPEPGSPSEAMPLGVLCVDRADPRPWSEVERQILRLTARKIALDVETGRTLTDTDRGRRDINRFCAGLRALNGVLGLEEVAGAALDAVAALVPFDFGAIVTTSGELHKVAMVRGLDADSITGLAFTSDEGLVGQAISTRAVLPAEGPWRGHQPIFTADDQLSALKALMVVPLIKKGAAPGQPPLGALVVGATDEGAYDGRRRDMVELVADQVAIKLDLAQAHEQIREMATLDGLTGLANHRVFQQAFDNMLARSVRGGHPVCVLLTDIDRFKSVNDTYGHPFGDVVLKGVAKVLGRAVRKVDLAARYGGEEFALLLEDTGAEGGMLLAERIRQEVESLTFDFEGKPVKVTLSLGVAAYPASGVEKADLIARADEALYHAKHSGRNRAVSALTLQQGEASVAETRA